MQRRATLKDILQPVAGVQLGSYVANEGRALFELPEQRGMGGIVAKRKANIYQAGKRTSDWLKIKARLQQEFVVGGFTAPKGSRKHLAQWGWALTLTANSGTMGMPVLSLAPKD